MPDAFDVQLTAMRDALDGLNDVEVTLHHLQLDRQDLRVAQILDKLEGIEDVLRLLRQERHQELRIPDPAAAPPT